MASKIKHITVTKEDIKKYPNIHDNDIEVWFLEEDDENYKKGTIIGKKSIVEKIYDGYKDQILKMKKLEERKEKLNKLNGL